ncbi:MAG: SIMPL domain-containing protein [Kordiimonadaceae bacterium]|jgi:uncharacterized protein|nr:SIMPL domain-containing protein [Kordiimonadaceae bacterium]MBT6035119.1 SIMPL domain-containing protein [Kordiimonadaceae bacterium]MBT6329146.1 SIMPL domain-containing protein [Kordiimonadaceae bacterium]
MKILTSLAVLISSIFLINASHAQEGAFCQGPVITMSAIGEIESLPDVAEVSLNVKSQAKDETSALIDLSANIEKIINVLEDLKIKDEDMRTDSISIRPVYDQRNRQEIIAYAGATSVHFKTFDLNKITDLMSGVMAGSDNLFSNITCSSTDKENLEDQARKAAFKKALHKANLYAELAGENLGNICTITEGQVQMMPRRIDMMRQETMAMRSAPVDISIPIKPGKITTTAQVTLVYQLEN